MAVAHVLAGTVELRNTLGRAFALELPASLAFDCHTAAAVAEHVASTLRAGRPLKPATAQSCLSSFPRAVIHVMLEIRFAVPIMRG